MISVLFIAPYEGTSYLAKFLLFWSLLIKQTFRELVIVYNLWIALTFKVPPTFNLGGAVHCDIYQ